MKVLVFSTSTNNTDTVIDSLKATNLAEVDVFRYDTRFLQRVALAVQANPKAAGQLQAGQLHFDPSAVRRDAEMLTAAREKKPDLMIYISAWEGDFVPAPDTLGELNEIAPLVHLCFDASDPPWWPQMMEFEKKGIFSLTVNIDGGHVWPGGTQWQPGLMSGYGVGPGGPWIKGLTVLTPVDPKPFAGVQLPYLERPYRVGYAGNAGGWIRDCLVTRLGSIPGFAKKLRDDVPGSYAFYVQFLKHVQVSVSVPFTGSNAAKHVKGRVVESAFAGCCLLEWKNPATRAWFLPRYEYEEYESIDECLEIAAWLAGHPRRAAEMAAAMQQRVLREHAADVMWGKVFAGAGREPVMSMPYKEPSPILLEATLIEAVAKDSEAWGALPGAAAAGG